MCISMAKTVQEERLRWVLPIARKEVKLVDVAKVCPHSKRSLERWVGAYREGGETALELKSTRPKTHPEETAIRIKEEVVKLRKRTRLCALKLKWRLAKQGIHIHERTIGKILKVEGLVRRYRVRRVKYKYLRAELKPGELIEMDVKYVPQKLDGMRYYQYTAIDCASRWRYLAVYPEQANEHSVQFLAEVIRRFPYLIRAVKTDNHSTFTNAYTGMNRRSDRTVKTIHAVDRFCTARGIVHYLIDPGKPAQNGKVERSHRSDQETFYDRTTLRSVPHLRHAIRIWNNQYNNLEHCGLDGRTPTEYLLEYQSQNPPYVRT